MTFLKCYNHYKNHHADTKGQLKHANHTQTEVSPRRLYSNLRYAVNGAGEFEKTNGIFFFAGTLKLEPRSLFCLYVLQSFSQIGSRSEMCFIPFHSRPRSQGSRCRNHVGEGGRNPKVFACSHETFATLNRRLCSPVGVEQPFIFFCKSHEVPSHRSLLRSRQSYSFKTLG